MAIARSPTGPSGGGSSRPQVLNHPQARSGGDLHEEAVRGSRHSDTFVLSATSRNERNAACRGGAVPSAVPQASKGRSPLSAFTESMTDPNCPFCEPPTDRVFFDSE